MKPDWTYFPIEDTHNDTCYGISMRDKIALELFLRLHGDGIHETNAIHEIVKESYKIADIFIEESEKV